MDLLIKMCLSSSVSPLKDMLCFFDTPLQKSLQALVLSHLGYCPVIWSSAAKKDLVKLHLAQNRATHLAIHCNQRANINTMHTSLSFVWTPKIVTAAFSTANGDPNKIQGQAQTSGP